MNSMAPEDMTIFEMLDDLDPACDYAEDSFCLNDRAEWIMFRLTCTCGIGGAVLACSRCKDARLTTELGVACHGCGEIYQPARLRYGRVEQL